MSADESEQPIPIQELADGVIPLKKKTNPEASVPRQPSTKRANSRIEIRTPACPIMRERRPPIHTRSVGSRLRLMPEVRYRVGPKEIAEETMRAGFLLSIHLEQLKSMLVSEMNVAPKVVGERDVRKSNR
jgi:hypothetical protein